MDKSTASRPEALEVMSETVADGPEVAQLVAGALTTRAT